MKKVILSFDDGRLDFYNRAYPLLLKYTMPATLNVTSGFVLRPQNFIFTSANNQPMTMWMIKKCQKNGIEIACHGSNHINTKSDLLLNIAELKSEGISIENIGFASPHSQLTKVNRNDDGIWDLVDNKTIAYIRTGTQIRREGFLYTILSIINRYLSSSSLFRILNKNNIIKDLKEPFLPSVTIYSYTTNKQISRFIEMMPGGSSVILMFHSILDSKDAGYGKDKFYWDISHFEELLSFLRSKTDIEVCTTINMVQACINHSYRN